MANYHTPKELVRSFSNDLRKRMPGETLSRGLIFNEAAEKQRDRAEIQDQWNMLLNGGRALATSVMPTDEQFLLEQSRHLYKAWTSFCKTLPEDQRKGILTELPNIQYLYDSVKDAADTWEENRNSGGGKIKKTFSRVCDVLQSHSNLVSIFPTDDKYVRLVTGSISAIARASINHTKIASGVADCLEELSQDMSFWNRLIDESGKGATMQRFIIELYTVVVEFLTQIFEKWLGTNSWKRFVQSFNEKATQQIFADKRERIKKIEARMEKYVDLEIKKRTERKLDDLKTQIGALSQQLSDQDTRFNLFNRSMVRLGADFDKQLRESLSYVDGNAEVSGILPCMDVGPSSDSSLHKDTPSIGPVMISSENPLSESPGLSSKSNDNSNGVGQDQYNLRDILILLEDIAVDHRERIHDLIRVTSRAKRVEIELQIRTRIMTWVADVRTDKLWIQGPHDVPSPSQNTLTAAFLVALFNAKELPCLHYFCSLNSRQRNNRNSMSRTMLVHMLKSFIVQLLLMRRKDELYIDIPFDFFERLIDTTKEVDIDELLVVFRGLQAVAPSHLNCVIENIQELEDRGDAKHTRNLAKVLREILSLNLPLDRASGRASPDAIARDGTYRSLKLILLSDGYVDILAQATADEELEKLEYMVEADRIHDGEFTELAWLEKEDDAFAS